MSRRLPLLSPRRLRQWIEALKLAGITKVPWLGLVRAVLSGPVPRKVWRARMRACLQCPLFSVEHTAAGRVHLCRSNHPDMMGVGCGCYLPFLAMAATPYPDGCFGREIDPDLGWGVHHWPSRGARLMAVIDFLFPWLQKRSDQSSTQEPPRPLI